MHTTPSRTVLLHLVPAALIAVAACGTTPLGIPASAIRESQPTAPARTGVYLDASQVDPTTVLPAPPADDSAATRCEIELLLTLQADSPEPTRARALAEDRLTVWVFAEVLGPGFKQSAMPRTAAIMARAAADARPVLEAAKAAWPRRRPPMVDARIKPLIPTPDSGAYPSGHAAQAIIWARLLAQLAPDRAADLEHRARLIAADRIILGVHYPSDVAAGVELGEQIARLMLESPALRSDLEQARQEWTANDTPTTR